MSTSSMTIGTKKTRYSDLLVAFYGEDFVYGPYKLWRDVIWAVGRPNLQEGGYEDTHYFFFKKNAIAHMVKLQLEGKPVRWE